MGNQKLVYAVANSDDPARTLELIEGYVALKKRDKEMFALPEEHAWLEPVISLVEPSDNLFRAFVLLVRNDLAEVCGEASFQYKSTQEFARKIAVRIAAQKRRARLQPALDWAKIHMPERSVEERRQWLLRLEQTWAEERRQALKYAKHKKGAALTVDEKADVLDAFWSDLDARIEAGSLPPWEDLM